MAQQGNQAIAYVYPSEEANFWIDTFVIPKGAKNVKIAHKFIAFMLRPDIAKMCVEKNDFATPVTTAIPLISKEVRESATIFPSAKIVKNGESRPTLEMHFLFIRSTGRN